MAFHLISYGESPRKDKKRQVVFMLGAERYNLHFGDRNYEDFTTHGDEKRRLLYRLRAQKIKDKSGNTVFDNPSSPAFWSFNVLWSQRNEERSLRQAIQKINRRDYHL